MGILRNAHTPQIILLQQQTLVSDKTLIRLQTRPSDRPMVGIDIQLPFHL